MAEVEQQKEFLQKHKNPYHLTEVVHHELLIEYFHKKMKKTVSTFLEEANSYGREKKQNLYNFTLRMKLLLIKAK